MKDANLTNYDGQSDISDSVVQACVDEVKEYNPDYEDKFRVDRKKLELMLQNSVGEHENAEEFFQRIMDETNTVITWPSKLKIGAKSKKDPHIKVTGRPEDIRNAKMKVKEILDTKTDRVTLKMDVSYTDHSHLIGKGGSNIQRVMDKTGCHIHFPDSNRNITSEKSNHVSIAGHLEGVEQARACIRNMLPLVFTFEYPINGLLQSIVDVTSPFILNIQQWYNVKISFRQQTRQCVVRGSESWADKVKKATVLLIEHLMGNARSFVPVTMTTEITHQHHLKVKENCDKYMITQKTGTVINFLNARGTVAKSTVTASITGSIDGVHYARKLLMDGLPLVLLFDLREDQEIDNDKIASLMQQFDVSIHAQQKQKTALVGVTVKGTEKDAKKLYDVRRMLLGLDYCTPCNTPKSLDAASSANSCNGYLDYRLQNLSLVGQNLLGYNTVNSCYHSPLPSPNLSLHSGSGISTGGWNTSSTYPGYYPLYPYIPNTNGPHSRADGWHSWNARHDDGGFYSAPSSTTSSLSSPAHSPRRGSPVDTLQPVKCGSAMYSESSINNALSLKEERSSSTSRNDNSTTTVCMASQSNTKVNKITATINDQDSFLKSEVPHGSKSKVSMYDLCFPSDYDYKKALASKAMRKKPEEPEIRIPTNSWAGYGLSHSMSANVVKKVENLEFEENENSSKEGKNVDKDPWKDSPTGNLSSRINMTCSRNVYEGSLGRSNYIDSASLPLRSSFSIGKYTDLADLFNDMGFSKYIQLFEKQEIDLETFMTLTEQDLKDLGISQFGVRRKMYCAITRLKQQTSAFSPAPGAERKLSSSFKPLL